MPKSFYAHSLPGQPPESWQPLTDHLAATAAKAAEFAMAALQPPEQKKRLHK